MKRKIWTSICLFILLLFLILDTKTVIHGAKEGIELCLYTVIPSLFPFLILSKLLCSRLTGKSIRFLRPVGKLCGIPQGAESILLLGLLAGYPVGAQCVRQTYIDGNLSKEDAHRLLGFCSNAGPSFIFGIIGCLFEAFWVPWVLWLIHIGTALLVGVLLPGKQTNVCSLQVHRALSIPEALEHSIKTMANICGWIVTFRVIVYALQHWILWILPMQAQVAFIGLLELSNGCMSLLNIPEPGLRFIFAAGILGAGGLCVAMQTVTVVRELGIGMYFPGKLLHCLLSILFAVIIQSFLFSQNEVVTPSSAFYAVIGGFILFYVVLIRKLTVDFQERLLYNTREPTRKGADHAVSEKNSPFLQLLRIRHKA